MARWWICPWSSALKPFWREPGLPVWFRKSQGVCSTSQPK
jgi:hypothetical protein